MGVWNKNWEEQAYRACSSGQVFQMPKIDSVYLSLLPLAIWAAPDCELARCGEEGLLSVPQMHSLLISDSFSWVLFAYFLPLM